MCVGERLTGSNDGVKISLEEFDVQVDRVKVMAVNNVHVIQTNNLKLDIDQRMTKYIFVSTEVLEEFDFTEGTFCEDSLGEDVRNLRQHVSLCRKILSSLLPSLHYQWL